MVALMLCFFVAGRETNQVGSSTLALVSPAEAITVVSFNTGSPLGPLPLPKVVLLGPWLPKDPGSNSGRTEPDDMGSPDQETTAIDEDPEVKGQKT
jgi:hypothetical protein